MIAWLKSAVQSSVCNRFHSPAYDIAVGQPTSGPFLDTHSMKLWATVEVPDFASHPDIVPGNLT